MHGWYSFDAVYELIGFVKPVYAVSLIQVPQSYV